MRRFNRKLRDMAPLYDQHGITLYHGESLSLLMEMESASADGFLTDPPYSSGGQFRGDRAQSTNLKYSLTGTVKRYPEFDGDTRDQRAFLAWSTLWLDQAQRITKPGGFLGVFADWRQLGVMIDAVQAGGWVFRGICPWNKTRGCRPQKGWFRGQCEYVILCSKGSLGQERDRVSECLDGFFQCPVQSADKWHQTGKPLGLMLEILRVIQPGGRVIDPFAGGATTLMACRQLGLQCIGIERVAEQSAMAAERLQLAEQSRLNLEGAFA